MTYLSEVEGKNSGTRLLSRCEAAQRLNIRPQTLACWASTRRYDLPFIKVGRRVMYRLADIERFITDNLIVREAA